MRVTETSSCIRIAESTSAPMAPASHDAHGAPRLTPTTHRYRATVEDVPNSPEQPTQSTFTPTSEALDIPGFSSQQGTPSGWSSAHRSSPAQQPVTDDPVAPQSSTRPCATLLVDAETLPDGDRMGRPPPPYSSLRMPVNVPAFHAFSQTCQCQPSTYSEVDLSDCDSAPHQSSHGASTPISAPDAPRPYAFTRPLFLRPSVPPRWERAVICHGPAGPGPGDGHVHEDVWLLRDSQPHLYIGVPPAGGSSSHRVHIAHSGCGEGSYPHGTSEARGYYHTSDTRPMPTYEPRPHVPPLNPRRTFYGRPDGPPVASQHGQTPPPSYTARDSGLRPARRNRRSDLHHERFYPFPSHQAHPAWSGHTRARSSTHYS